MFNMIKHCRFVPGDDVVVMAVVVSLVDVLVISPDVEVSIKITFPCRLPGPGFPTSNVVVFFMFGEFELAVIVRFTGICGIIYHHCLNCLFIIISMVK
jgi:hypothetical protein